MDYHMLMTQIEKEEESQEVKAQKLKDLQEYIKAQNHLYDDHGPLIVGSREKPPQFKTFD